MTLYYLFICRFSISQGTLELHVLSHVVLGPLSDVTHLKTFHNARFIHIITMLRGNGCNSWLLKTLKEILNNLSIRIRKSRRFNTFTLHCLYWKVSLQEPFHPISSQGLKVSIIGEDSRCNETNGYIGWRISYSALNANPSSKGLLLAKRKPLAMRHSNFQRFSAAKSVTKYVSWYAPKFSRLGRGRPSLNVCKSV